MRNVELVIFDMDGLMFDTERIAFISWKRAAEKFGYELTEEVFKLSLGANLEKTKGIYKSHLGEDCPIDDMAEERFAITEELINTSGVPVKEGLFDLLSYLGEAGIKKAVATSTGRERACRLIEMAGIHTHFDYIICGDEIERSKPDPDIFLKVADKLDCPPERCMVLEDSEAGVQAAFSAGMMPVMIPDMKEPAEEILEMLYRKLGNLSEVKGLIEKLNK